MIAIPASHKTMRLAGLLTPALAVVVLLVGLPLVIMAYISLLDRGSTGGVTWNSPLSLHSYHSLLWDEDFDGNIIFNATYLSIFVRSAVQAAVTTFLCVLLGLPVALWMSSLSKSWKNVMVLLITIPFWTNLLVRNYAWLIILREKGFVQSTVNSLWPANQPVQLLYTDFAVAVGLVYSFLPFMILPIYSAFEKFDWRLLEAAYDLGANRRRAFARVIVPLSMPGIVAGSMLVFIPALGSFVTPALLGGGKTMMIGNLIQMQFSGSRNWPLGASLSIVVLTLLLITLMVFSLYRNRNITLRGK